MSNPPRDGSLKYQFEQATLELAIAQNALTDAADFVRSRAPTPQEVGIDHAADDPHVILRFGQLRARLHAAEGLLARAARLTSASNLPVAPDARPNGAGPATSPAATVQAGLRTRRSNAAAPPVSDAGGVYLDKMTLGGLTNLQRSFGTRRAHACGLADGPRAGAPGAR